LAKASARESIGGANDDDDRLDRIFGALSHRVRRSILRRLSDGGATVTELADPFAISLPAISKHLRLLEDAGLIDRAISGRVHRCSLDGEAFHEVNQWLTTYRVFWEGNLAALAAAAEAEDDDE